MTDQVTINKLYEMHLTAMAEAFRDQRNDPKLRELSFEERLGMLVDIEWTRRKRNRLRKLISNANFKYSNACVADVQYHDDRRLDRSYIHDLASCSYIADNHNIIIMGASGSGKTWLACAFGIEACKHYYQVRYVRLPDLLDELLIARGEDKFRKVIAQYKKVKLLIIDEWLLLPLNDLQSRDLLEIIEVRYNAASTIFCTQFKAGGWHEKICQDTLADAILDRVVHNAHDIFIDGKLSMRERNGLSGRAIT